jgi:hypothetical protein
VKTVRFIAAAALALGTQPLLNTLGRCADRMKTESAKRARVGRQANLKIQ